MNNDQSKIDRRTFVAGALATASAAAMPASLSQAADDKTDRFQFCAFEKFIQDLSYDQLGETIAELGFHGIEATVRKGGHIEPERQ